MQRRPFLASALVAAASATVTTLAAAQGFPARPVTVIVPNPPGGIVDSSARIVADSLAKVLSQSVVVENRGGGSGNVAYGAVARAPADGYTLLSSYSAYHVGNPALMAKLPWAQKDFAPVALVTAGTNVIAVHPSVPANTLPEFIEYLKKNPGKLSYASQGNGSLSHVGTEMFKTQTGTNMVHIPYKGSGPAIQDVLSGQVQVFITTPPSVMQHVQAGKLKGLAVTGKTRHPGLPDVPTTAEAGLKGFELEAWVGMFAPAGTPPDVIDRLSTGIKQALEQPEAKTRAAGAGIDLRYLPPSALEALVTRETAFWAKTIKAANITAD
ncbi:MAG TPA: tripartite tricarboxylate transporter substrate binding protein [Ramlibacter sp.]|jgi:tripartite-type tricarboxylate transporter receptor subunit TctC|uniref:Bug family tripartite tricarboxylate transporter substrate binding protein n=1 Tax=Ramlibacter sp. TaxID=1917967 RepID=UPI002D5512EA|nr:tripartite tricarboxylate transporter substrate binding protein [Ramlibacter sp.]HZY20539.1 tripartite tricarboxylate transporter substrate binding protein [Ramlibacter sp.]